MHYKMAVQALSKAAAFVAGTQSTHESWGLFQVTAPLQPVVGLSQKQYQAVMA
jgi:hypothetical protein